MNGMNEMAAPKIPQPSSARSEPLRDDDTEGVLMPGAEELAPPFLRAYCRTL